jgi:hypothetical protein
LWGFEEGLELAYDSVSTAVIIGSATAWGSATGDLIVWLRACLFACLVNYSALQLDQLIRYLLSSLISHDSVTLSASHVVSYNK